MLYRTVVMLALASSCAAFSPSASLRPAARPALRAAKASMLAPEIDIAATTQACTDAVQYAYNHLPVHLIAKGAEAQEIDATLIAQLSVIALMLGGGTALNIWGDVEEPEEEGAEDGSVDLYRDTPLRYMGYANECGEAFRPLIDVSIVYLTYVGAITYILADTFDKGKKGSEVEMEGVLKGAVTATDCFCWQMLASVIYPSYCINRIVILLVSLQATPGCPELLSADWIPTVVGLVMIPLIIAPLDTLAHQTLNLSFRRFSKAVGMY